MTIDQPRYAFMYVGTYLWTHGVSIPNKRSMTSPVSHMAKVRVFGQTHKAQVRNLSKRGVPELCIPWIYYECSSPEFHTWTENVLPRKSQTYVFEWDQLSLALHETNTHVTWILFIVTHSLVTIKCITKQKHTFTQSCLRNDRQKLIMLMVDMKPYCVRCA